MKIIDAKDHRDRPRNITKLAAGGLWEENEIEIWEDCPIYGAEECNCPHIGEKYIVRSTRADGTYYDTVYADCPRVIVAENEGGNNNTGTCLDCIRDYLLRNSL